MLVVFESGFVLIAAAHGFWKWDMDGQYRRENLGGLFNSRALVLIKVLRVANSIHSPHLAHFMFTSEWA
jgi:hypothetical protein